MRLGLKQWLALAFSLVFAMSLSALAWAQEAKPTLAILQVDDTNYPQVKVLASVADANGIPITGLQKDAFLVTEDGRSTPIQAVQEVSGGAELNIALALDVSGSMKGRPIEATRQAAARLLQSLTPQDKAALLIFNQKVKELAPLGGDRNAMIASLQSIQADGDTALYDAIHQGVMLVKDAPSGRRAVVIFSDGEDTRSNLTLNDAVTTAQRFSVPVYIVGYGPKIQPKELQRIAQLTGGAFFRAPKLEDIPTAFAQALDTLHRAYEIVYLGETPADDREHELRVVLTLSGQSVEESARFVARSGVMTATLTWVKLPDRAAAESVWNLLGEGALDANTPLLGGEVTADVQVQPGRNESMNFYLDDEQFAADAANPFTFDASSLNVGNHVLRIDVWDHVGNMTQLTQPVAIIPTVQVRLDAPAPDEEVTGIAPVALQVASIQPIQEVAVTLGGAELKRFTGPPYEFEWDATATPSGKQTLDVIVVADDGQQHPFSFPVVIGKHIQVELKSPKENDSLKGRVTIQAEVKSDARVKHVVFQINDQEIERLTNPPYKVQIHTGDYPPGSYELKVVAENIAGMKASDAVEVEMTPATRTGALGIALILALGVLIVVPIIFFARKRRQSSEASPPGVIAPPEEEPPPTELSVGAAPQRAPIGWLTLTAGKADKSQYPIYPGETRIGRHREFADIRLTDLGVSRRHAIITAGPEGVFYQDLNDQNPSRINGQPVEGRVQLHNGDRIQLGETEFIFQT